MRQKVCKKTHHEDTLNRRAFLGQTAAMAGSLALPIFIPASVLGAEGHVAPSNRINLAQIGLGVMGRGHVRRLAYDRVLSLVAICDVDRERLKTQQENVAIIYQDKRCTGYNDYREILARDDIDGVVIVTPDHWHTPQAMDAAKAGKDVYCEKPVSIGVAEGRALVQTVQKHGRIFQTGTQYRSIPQIRQICNFVRQGGLGRVKQAFTLWGRMAGYVRQGRFKPYIEHFDVEAASRSYVPLDIDLPGEPVPAGLDWQRWVGPSPWHDYNRLFHINPMPGVVPWAFHRDFGVGAVTGYHSHAADVIQYALGVEESGPAVIHHPQDSVYPTLTCEYANGTCLHLVENWADIKRLYQAVPGPPDHHCLSPGTLPEMGSRTGSVSRGCSCQ